MNHTEAKTLFPPARCHGRWAVVLPGASLRVATNGKFRDLLWLNGAVWTYIGTYIQP